jgi:AcrR family transcriptional regulator
VTSRPATRGPYAKGRLRRAEIIEAALDVLAVNGLRHSSLQEIAARVGVTRPGLLHYFGSREGLLMAVLEARDAIDIQDGHASHRPGEPIEDAFLRVLARTRESPGLAGLYTAFAAEAADPLHPAHDFFKERYARVRAGIEHSLRQEIADGHLSASIDPRLASQQVLAVLDGLQLQWLLDPDLDVGSALASSMKAILPST